jgi:hypothetical protein
MTSPLSARKSSFTSIASKVSVYSSFRHGWHWELERVICTTQTLRASIAEVRVKVPRGGRWRTDGEPCIWAYCQTWKICSRQLSISSARMIHVAVYLAASRKHLPNCTHRACVLQKPEIHAEVPRWGTSTTYAGSCIRSSKMLCVRLYLYGVCTTPYQTGQQLLRIASGVRAASRMRIVRKARTHSTARHNL